jgi:hypothetical protein
MNLIKPKAATVGLLTAGVLSAGTALLAPRVMADSYSMPKVATQHGGAGESLTNDNLTWVEKRVQEWQPTPEERSLDGIGWAHDIRTAEQLAKEHGRPVFLFTHDGRMEIGRC